MLKHLLQISDLTRSQIEHLIKEADTPILPLTFPAIQNNVAALLFYENSTRTRVSFELSANAVGLKTVNLDVQTSSVKKDETLEDTIQTLGAMGIQYFVIRHPQSNIVEKMADLLGEELHFINAGDGTHAHPTQGLLDMLTIYQKYQRFDDLSVGILGDSLHSRVAKSDITALQLLGCRDIRLIGPNEWLLPKIPNVTHYDNETGLQGLDVIITLRVQKERMAWNEDELKQYIQQYQLNDYRLKLAKPNAIIMHPGPINRGIEIASEVADSAQSMILKQVENGIKMRTAVWKAIL